MEKEKVTDISVVILTKNEAATIEECILSVESLKPREVIVIDDNSTDMTVVFARKRGAHVFIHEKKNFAEARNFGLTKVSGKWVLYIDADEQVTRELSQEILEIISSQFNPVAYEILRVNFYLGKRWPYTEKLARLFKKTAIQNWYGEVHESPRVDGEVGRLTQPLTHYTHRNLSEMVENTLVWSKIEAKLRFNAHHPPVSWWRIPRVMIPTFFDYYIRQGGWKVGTVGLIESVYQAFSIFITYARLWEMQQNQDLRFMKVGIYDPYMHILGGGERYVLAIAQCLSTHAEVTVFADNQELLDQVKTKLGLTLKNTSITTWPSERSERDRLLSRFDLFFYVTDGSLFASSAHKNILIIQSPAHIPKLTLFNRLKLRSWQAIFCYSEFMARIIKKRLGTIAQPLFVPISNTTTIKTHKDNLILSVGRFFPQLHNKKQLEMVEIFAEMVKDGLKNTTLYLVGSVDPGGEAYFEKVKEASKKLPVKVIRSAPNDKLQKLYTQAKIYWHATGFAEDLINYPEKAEHFGVTTIEAMARGCVPIVFNAGGQPEIVQHNKNGFLWTTKAELKKYTLEVLTSDALYQKLSQNALESAKLYRQEVFCGKLDSYI